MSHHLSREPRPPVRPRTTALVRHSGLDRYNAAGDRWCSGCRAYHPLACAWEPTGTTFGRDASRADGLFTSCREWERAKGRELYQKHRATRDATVAAWRAAHPETVRAMQRLGGKVYRLRKRLDQQQAEEQRKEETA